MSDTLDDDAVPEQAQSDPPDDEADLTPRPQAEMARYASAQKLAGRIALVTGGDGVIGRAVAVGFAKEGADVAITWLNEAEDAMDTYRLIEAEGVRVLSIPGDIADPDFCRNLVRQVVAEFSRIDILVNNAAEHHAVARLEDLADDQIERSFRANVFSQFFLTRAALPHIEPGGSIINSTSVLAYTGSPTQVDYAATKGAIVSFTRSLAAQLLDRDIRVNAVAPGPIMTPLSHPTAAADAAPEHGEASPMRRPGQPDEIAPSYIFLASSDASYMTGQVLHPNGGTMLG